MTFFLISLRLLFKNQPYKKVNARHLSVEHISKEVVKVFVSDYFQLDDHQFELMCSMGVFDALLNKDNHF